MSADDAIGPRPRATGEASRRQIRATLLDALARHAQTAGEGVLRQQLEARRQAWLVLDAAVPPLAGAEVAEPKARAVRPPLADLLDGFAAAHPAGTDAYPELPELEQFRRNWDALHARRQLERTLAPAPADAGPLNSSVLARRAIALMQSASPAYLRHFIDYADTLAWLESLRADGVLPASVDAARSPSGTKPAARRASRRR